MCQRKRQNYSHWSFCFFLNKSPQDTGGSQRSVNWGFPSALKKTPAEIEGERDRSGSRGYLCLVPWRHHLENIDTTEKAGNGCRVHTDQWDQKQLHPRAPCPSCAWLWLRPTIPEGWRRQKTKRKKETGQVWKDLISAYPSVLILHKVQKCDTVLGRDGETPGGTEVKISFH